MKKSSMKTRMDSSSAAVIVQKKASRTETLEEKRERLRLLEARKSITEGLPHKYGQTLYQWQRDFLDAPLKGPGKDKRMQLICAANQIGKSWVLIAKMVYLATETSQWPKLWAKRPTQFWFLSVDRNFILREFESKWSKEILPQGEFRTHPQYGWEPEFKNKFLHAIRFNSGITCYFSTYSSDPASMQGSTIDALFLDEEPEWSLMPELLLRVQAKNGFVIASMTPTKSQEEWRRVFMEIGTNKEIFPEAFKQKISVFDCLKKEDGSPGLSDEYITRLMNRLATENERRLRLYGDFVASENLKFPAFNREVNVIPPTPTPETYLWFSGVDLGGGGSGSLPAIVFVAVHPNRQYGKVVDTWRGDSSQLYTATDVIDKYVEMRAGRVMSGEFYDFSSKDFGILAHRAGVAMMPAEKSHAIGVPLMNTLFKNKMLQIEDTKANDELALELTSLREDANKRSSSTLDHLSDALRYAVVKVGWSLEGISGEKLVEEVREKSMMERARPNYFEEDKKNVWSVDEDIAEFNALMDPDW